MFNHHLCGTVGSTSSSLCEHWISRLMGSRPPSQASSGSSRRTSLASLSESAEFAGERSEDDGEGVTISDLFSMLQRCHMNIFLKNLILMCIFLLCRLIKPASSKGHAKTNVLLEIVHCQPTGA